MFDEFIEILKKENNLLNSVNQYSKETEFNEITSNNLKLYLNNIYKRSPEYIFIGEAPGYKGCRITGIPFTSEYILLQDFKNGLFGNNNGYKIINVENPYKESTATIIWQYFRNKEIVPFFWNAFPFHPYKNNNFNSNRKPNNDEILIGIKYLDILLNIFKNSLKIVSIGDIAYNLLKNKYECKYVRHPSHGGKRDFIKGMNEIFEGE